MQRAATFDRKQRATNRKLSAKSHLHAQVNSSLEAVVLYSSSFDFCTILNVTIGDPEFYTSY